MNQSRFLDFYTPAPSTTFGSRFRSTVLPDGLKQKRLVRTSKTWKAWFCLIWMLGQRRERGIVRSPERVPGDRSTNSDPRNSQIQATSHRLTTWPRITPRTSRSSGVRSLRRPSPPSSHPELRFYPRDGLIPMWGLPRPGRSGGRASYRHEDP